MFRIFLGESIIPFIFKRELHTCIFSKNLTDMQITFASNATVTALISHTHTCKKSYYLKMLLFRGFKHRIVGVVECTLNI